MVGADAKQDRSCAVWEFAGRAMPEPAGEGGRHSGGAAPENPAPGIDFEMVHAEASRIVEEGRQVDRLEGWVGGDAEPTVFDDAAHLGEGGVDDGGVEAVGVEGGKDLGAGVAAEGGVDFLKMSGAPGSPA